jgi:hypothetical protein
MMMERRCQREKQREMKLTNYNPIGRQQRKALYSSVKWSATVETTHTLATTLTQPGWG